MFTALIIITSILVALARGGRFSNFARLEFNHIWLLFLPLLFQIIAFSPLGDYLILDTPIAKYLYFLSMALAAVALWLNRRLPGAPWIAAGFALNFLAISLNGGFMPVSETARQIAGQAPLLGRDKNTIPMTSSTLLPWIGDVIPIPGFLPFASVFSLGDLLIAIGGIIFIQRALVLPKSGAGSTHSDA